MKNFRHILVVAGVLSFAVALFQAVIGFFPSLSIYFGAPESLAENAWLLIIVSLSIAAILTVFGIYAISGAGFIRPLPWLKPILVLISGIYTLRGLLLIPELLVVIGLIDLSIPVAPRFVVFSIAPLLTGLLYFVGTFGGWRTFPSKKKRPSNNSINQVSK